MPKWLGKTRRKKKEWETMANNFAIAAHCVEKGAYPACTVVEE